MLKIQRRLKSGFFILSLFCFCFSTVNLIDRHLKYKIMAVILCSFLILSLILIYATDMFVLLICILYY